MSEKEVVSIEEVTVALMQMVQYYTNHINFEMLNLLHSEGYCNQFVQMCLLCKQEEQAALDASQTNLEDFTEEE